MNHKRFLIAFCLDRMTVFEVKYGALAERDNWYFSTSASVFNQPKTDWSECGQCQRSVLDKFLITKFHAAMGFFIRWDHFHLQNMSKQQYAVMRTHVENLKKVYPYFIEKGEDYPLHYIPFEEIRKLSMTVPRKR